MIKYTLIRSKRKTLSLSVSVEGDVVVRTGNRVPKYEIDDFVEKHSAWIDRQRKLNAERRIRFPELSGKEAMELKKTAGEYIPKRVEYYAAVMGLTPSGVKITSAKKRFGSCSPNNSLCFSYLLMRYPPEAIDYVVVHELSHIIHKNHGVQFYKTISEILPDYKSRSAMLRK